eukprot:Phypoly_transcript_12663.p1 GENE.Phypoly_transcript_12663~~Phypoly_transcript_12663.p1  ORF type:complete len:334 (+),score=51.21 Phypoly_transcript_12663:68-1069(+)
MLLSKFRKNRSSQIFVGLTLFVFIYMWYSYSIVQETARKIKNPNGVISFGVITDIQYANKEAAQGSDRYEKDAINKVTTSLKHWSSLHASTPLEFIINLGDIIDGHTGDDAEKKDAQELQQILDIFSTLNVPKYHLMGNHGVRNLGCKKLSKKLGMPNNFYEVKVGNGWRFLFLDGTDMSLMIDSFSHKEAEEYVKHNKERNLGHWNGGFGTKQKKWLQETMKEAKKKKEKLILFCHWPLLNMWTPDFESSLLWNSEEILAMLDPEVVFMFMSGHMHENGYTLHNGIHHVTLGGVVTTPVGDIAHAVMHVGSEKVEIEGFGILSALSATFNVH